MKSLEFGERENSPLPKTKNCFPFQTLIYSANDPKMLMCYSY